MSTSATSATLATSATSFTHNLNYVLFDYWEEIWNIRSRDIPFMKGGPWPIMAFMLVYVFLAAKLGPAMMKNRKPYELRGAMLFYNITSVMFNMYFFVQAAYYLNFGMELLDFKFPANDPERLTEIDFIKARLAYLYVWTKMYDLIDTLFFVLRKKYNQISGLHLYHHSVVPILGWLVLKIAPTASVLGCFPLVNTMVHIIMYSYYALSAMGPNIQPYLWWKKYITQIQLAQFVFYGVYAICFAFFQEGYPVKFWIYVGFPQPFIFFYLFWSFYRQSYTEKKESLEKKHKLLADSNNNNSNGFFKQNGDNEIKKSL